MEDNTKYVINKSFKRLLLPTTIGSISVVSTILIGVALVSFYFGAHGLTVASLFIPLITLWGCLYESFGVGASAIFSLNLGKDNREKGKKIVSQFNFVTLVATLFIAVLGLLATFFFSASGLGVEEHLFDDAIWYARIMFITTIPLVLNHYFLFVLRTDSAEKIAFISSVTQVVANIVLSVLFMGPMGLGIKGAALAVFVASIISFAITVIYLLKKSTIGLTFAIPVKSTLKEVWEYAIDPIADNISELLISFFLHVFVLVVFGIEVASVIYIIHYIKMFVLYFSIGVTHSSSPILGVYFGEKNNKAINYMAAKGIRYALVAGALLAIFIASFAQFISVGIFSFEFTEMYGGMCNNAIRIYALSVILFLVNIVITNYCRQTFRFKMSLVITIARVLVFPFVFISIAMLIGSSGLIWWSFVITELITLVGWLIYMYRQQVKLKADSILCLPENKNIYKADIYFLILPNEEHAIIDYQEMTEIFLLHNNIAASKITRTTLALEEIMAYAAETNQRKDGYVDIRVAITQSDDVSIMVKLDNDTIDIMSISTSYNVDSSDLLSLHMLRSITTEFKHSRVLSFNTMSMVISNG